MNSIIVNDKLFYYSWEDMGAETLLVVLKSNGDVLGSKRYPLLVDNGSGIVSYFIKSILRGGHEKVRAMVRGMHGADKRSKDCQ